MYWRPGDSGSLSVSVAGGDGGVSTWVMGGGGAVLRAAAPFNDRAAGNFLESVAEAMLSRRAYALVGAFEDGRREWELMMTA